MFKQITRVCHTTFKFLCERLSLYLQKNNTRMKVTNSDESTIATSLQKLGAGNTLCIVGDVYGVAESTISEIGRIFYKLVRVHLQGTFVQFPSPTRFRILAQKFEVLHEILYIIRAIDGSYIPILAPVFRGEHYYCRKLFHSALLQSVGDTKCVFWDYEFGWAGNMYDWTLILLTKVGRDCIKSISLPYKLIRNCAYLVRPWILQPIQRVYKRFGRLQSKLVTFKVLFVCVWNVLSESSKADGVSL